MNWEIIKLGDGYYYWKISDFEGEIKLTEDSAKDDLINTLLDKIKELQKEVRWWEDSV